MFRADRNLQNLIRKVKPVLFMGVLLPVIVSCVTQGTIINGNPASVTIRHDGSYPLATQLAVQHCTQYGKDARLLHTEGWIMSFDCVTSQNSAKDKKTKIQMATRSMINCVRSNRQKMDDKVSGADLILSAIIHGPCYQDAEQMLEVTYRDSNLRVQEIARARFYNGTSESFKTLIGIVTQGRAQLN